MSFNGRVLAVDDDADLLELVCLALSRAGYEVEGAGDGKAAVEKAAGGAFDLVLLDIMLPRLDGVSALREIKKGSPATEVVMITAHSSVDTAVECMRLGAFDYLKKPFDISTLEAVTEKAVEKRRLAEVAAAALVPKWPDGGLDAVAGTAARFLGADGVALCSGGAAEAPGSTGGYGCGTAWRDLCHDWMRLLAEAGGGAFIVTLPGNGGRREPPGLQGLSSALFMPLTENGRFTGLLCAGRLPGGAPFGEADLRRVRPFAPVLSLAVRNYELSRQLREVRVRLAGSQKLEAVGMLAGQISHDFNNLLAVIIGSIQLLMENLGPGGAMKLSGEILKMAHEAEGLIKQLLLFVRRGEENPSPTDLNAAIEDIKFILLKLPGGRASLEYSLQAGLPRVNISPEHFKQLVVNLTANAKGAMPGGGKVTVSTRRGVTGDAVPAGADPAGFVAVEVADEGPGIQPGEDGKIFEPFFTTKPAGKGTGLGLYIVREIARASGGAVSAVNRPSGGAVFRVLLPAARA